MTHAYYFASDYSDAKLQLNSAMTVIAFHGDDNQRLTALEIISNAVNAVSAIADEIADSGDGDVNRAER